MTACLAISMIVAMSGFSTAALPAPPLPPSLPPPSGGGGSSGGGSSTPAFKAYTLDLNSSDGMTIGNITVKSHTLASARAEKSLGYPGGNVTVTFLADLDSMPSWLKLDITANNTSGISTPLDGLYATVLALNLTRFSSGGDWPMKSGTVNLTLKVPVQMMGGTDLDGTFYLAKDDTKGYVLYNAVPAVENGVVSFDVPLRYEHSSPSPAGRFVLLGTPAAPVATATPAPTATAVPTPTPQPTGSLAMSIVTLLSAVMLATILIGRKKRK
jgi:hypothetical protein